MKPAEFLTMHRARVQELYTKTGSWAKVYEMLSKSLPEIAGMSRATFKQYAPILIELNKALNNDDRLNNQVKQDQELNTVKQELEAVKHELNRLQELNTGLNKELELNKLNISVKQETVKHGLNISGWSIQESKGYFRAFKKVAGKMKAVYLGKNLDDAEMKIRNKEKQMVGVPMIG
jgi:hypothetical protein